MEYSIKQLAQLAGTTSRTLRHYDDLGLLPPSRVASNGYRHYDDSSVLVLQKILLLKNMGLSLEEIHRALESNANHIEILIELLKSLEHQRLKLETQISTVEQTINALQNDKTMDAAHAFEGFTDQYKDEVIERWGASAYEQSNDWWQALTAKDQQEFVANVEELNSAWIAAWKNGEDHSSETAQDLAGRHVAWLRSVPGTPAFNGSKEIVSSYVESLAHMYPADPRFAQNYGGEEGAAFVRDALLHLIRM